MIPYGRQTISTRDIKAMTDVFKTGWITQGPAISAFEQKVARYIGARHAAVVANGTAALHIAYLAAGIGKGDEVITTPNTFAATTNMLLAIGAKPVFCDIRMDTYNIDEKQIEKYVTKKTKAIVPVHFSGHPCEMNAIWRVARRHKLFVIEDGAQALGAKYRGKCIGSGGSDMVTYSFHPVKAITTGEGGMVVTNDTRLYERLLLFRNHGITKDAKGFNVMTHLGYNYRMTDLQAALGASQMDRLKEFLQKRHEAVGWYKAEFGKFDKVILPRELPGVYSGWHLYVIRVKQQKDRLPLYRHLQQSGIGVNFHFPNVYRHPYYQKRGFAKIHLANADLYHETAITLPLFPLLTRRDVRFICKAVRNYFSA